MNHASQRAALVLMCLAPACASAQAWLPDKGSFNTSLIYNNVLNKIHWDARGNEADAGHTRSETLAFLGTYGVTDRVMVAASLPYVTTRFWGPLSHGGAPGFEVDNGNSHSSFTDLRVGVHFQALERPFALAPFVAYVTPISNYPYRGHSALGRNVDELLIGFGAGKSLDPWLRRTFVQMRYSYGFVEKVLDKVHDRENLNLEIGTFINSRWNVSAYGAFQWTHGGLDSPIPPSSPYFYNHDSLLEEEYINAGVGTGYALTPEITAFAIYMEGIEGRNGHKMEQGVTVGFTYGFRPRASAVFNEEAALDSSASDKDPSDW